MEDRKAWGRPDRLWGWAMAAVLAALAFLYTVPVLPSPTVDAAYAAITLCAVVLGAAFALRRAARSAGSERAAWLLIGLANVAWAVGEAGWDWVYVVQRHEVPVPHWSDIAYLANIPLMVAGLLALSWRRGGARQAAVQAIDATATALAIFLAFWMLFLRGLAASAGDTAAGTLVTVLYPLADVGMLAAFALTVSRLERARLAQLWPLPAGLAMVALADLGWTVIVFDSGTYGTTLFDLGWTAGAFCIAWAALRPATDSAPRTGPANPLEQWLPLAAVVPALAMGAILIWRDQPTDRVLLSAGLAWVLLMLARQMLLLDLHVRLSRSLHEAQRMAGLGTWAWDPRRDMLELGPIARSILALPPSQASLGFIGLLAMVSPDEAAPLRTSWNALVAQGTPLDCRFHVALPEGRRLVHLRGERNGAIHGTLFDLSAQERMKEQEVRAAAREREVQRLKEINRFKTEFISTAAHELNTPLTPIRLSLMSLKNQPEAAPAAQVVRLLERNVDRLVRLLHDLLESARLQADRLTLQREDVDLQALVREAVDEHRAVARDRGIEVRAAAGPPCVVSADALRIHEVVGNLLSNALKFTPRGGLVHVAVTEGPELARITVHDTGRGIRAEDVARLFEPFSQVGDPLPSTVGTGLGLYISRGIVQQHGGRIWVESPGENLGTTFTVELPRRTVAQEAAAVVAEVFGAQGTGGAPSR